MVQTQAQTAIDTPHGTITWARRMRLLAAVCLCLTTGRRIGGLIAIRVEDIDLDRKELRVEREKGRTGRVLPVAEWAIAVVRTYLHDIRPLLVASADVPWLLVGAGDDGMMTRFALGEALASLSRARSSAVSRSSSMPSPGIALTASRTSTASGASTRTRSGPRNGRRRRSGSR